VRLEVSAAPDPRIRKWLMSYGEVAEADVYEISGPLDAAALMAVAARPGFEKLKDPEWPPLPSPDLPAGESVWETLQDHDALLVHPYESFEPVVDLLRKAAEDPNVLAIKQILYRTSGDSPVVAALARAAENGKQVTVLVELKARFDEARNVRWARRLEDAGCHVIYGVAGLKTHAKLLLVVRREPHGICRYVHLSTGNYNDRTARLYSDVGLLTSDRELAADVSAFCNLMTGCSQEVGWSHLAISPTGLRRRVTELIEREAALSTPEEPGLIMAKLNALEDDRICRALYRASSAGVRVRLNVRGICCLRPGVKGLSENVEVTSIVDRYLEHARILHFRNGGHEEVYLSSADWMRRNLDRRLEVLFPVLAPPLKARLTRMLETCFADNVKAWQLRPDGTYQRAKASGARVRAQEAIYQALSDARRAEAAEAARLRPLTSPQSQRDR
jgi:polyphosphate kinase